jgi:putative phosphonate catabolism associated alcohol dehydrogenase
MNPQIPREGRLAVYEKPNAPFEIRMFPIREPNSDEVLIKIKMSTICRSDIHSYLGHRPNPCPGVLGHEIIGNIIALGKHITHDMRGDELHIGDRVTWSEYFIPGNNYYTEVLDIPQKSPGVDKYGHMSVETAPHHHGGFGEYCYILPQSWILKLPSDMTDEEATPVNCGVATVMCVTEKAEIEMGDTVVVQGLGLLGLYAAAICKARGARLVIGLDTVEARRNLGMKFGADIVFNPEDFSDKDLIQKIKLLCKPEGADAVIELCGHPNVIPSGIQYLRNGGRYVLGGVVNPDSFVSIDVNQILKKLLTVRGVHNYHPRHLIQALDFVYANKNRFPFHDLVDGKYSLNEVGTAMKDAEVRKVLRAAIIP